MAAAVVEVAADFVAADLEAADLVTADLEAADIVAADIEVTVVVATAVDFVGAVAGIVGVVGSFVVDRQIDYYVVDPHVALEDIPFVEADDN